ncbi:T9SS type A sorting domain-containing protein [Polaribacter undariae]|uniref:T9SS type A sorting domain-containing protein n=1 Tax=Polaribacter sejongensis TaxID=985043 RepID=A0AAJ1VEU7_9FLAO|nr:T9SS type A sorting domain-containing protein [Polaribacter undariae]MDN3618146.1 T9SS type A sorting domain-containing protein [Polaribacter undariae]UWD30864.1 T9SS type A sorting domain-containing protein [Polaribacter undariae]
MKKNYFLLTLLCVSFLGFSQEFTIDFEGTDPLSNLPTGVTNVDGMGNIAYIDDESPAGNIQVYINANVYIVTALGNDMELSVDGEVSRLPFANGIITDTSKSSKVLQTDYTGHIIIDEAAIGTDDFSIRLDYMIFGHNMTIDAGFMTIVGEESAGVWNSDRIVSRNGGFTSGMGLSVGGDDGFRYGKKSGSTFTPEFNDVVLTYTSSDKLYRLYKNGELKTTSSAEQASGEWNNRKIYIGYSGANHPASNPSNLDTSTGEFTSNGVSSVNRNADLQTRMDNIQVYKKAISDADVTKLFNGGTLAVNQLSKETFKTFPNPVKDVLYFSTNTVSSVEIYNILGAKVLSQKVTNSVDMSDLKAGIYLLKATDTNNLEVKTLKVVKE